MSAKLFKDPQFSERPPHKTIRKIDDLILDAEQEAQAEIDQKLRSNNTRMLLLVLIGVGLFYMVINGPQNLSIPMPSFLTDEPRVAEAPLAPGPIPKPIPFLVGESTPAPEAGTPSVPAQPEATGQDLSPLENEVMSMIQKNLEAPEQGNSEAVAEPAEPASPGEPKSPVFTSRSPFAPETGNAQVPAAPKAPAMAATPNIEAPFKSAPSTSALRLTAAQSRYFIQVGAFSVKSNADRVIKRLMSGGFSPLVQTRTTRSSMYVVFIGGFADESSPQNMISELRKKGLNPVLKKNDNGSHSIILGQERSKPKAESLREDLTRRGIFTSLKQMKMDSRIYIVRVGNFDSNTSAVQNQKKIENMGYTGTLIRKKS
jgi:cell division protein FtsN